MPARQPTSWDEYERGASPGPSDSAASSLGNQSIRFEEQPLLSDNGSRDHRNGDRPAMGRRRLVITLHMHALHPYPRQQPVLRVFGGKKEQELKRRYPTTHKKTGPRARTHSPTSQTSAVSTVSGSSAAVGSAPPSFMKSSRSGRVSPSRPTRSPYSTLLPPPNRTTNMPGAMSKQVPEHHCSASA